MIDKTREIALKILYKIDKEKAYSNIVLNEYIKQNRKYLQDRDISLISEIVYGTTSWKLTIDEIIKKYSKIKLKKISSWILNILRMGIYQIIFLDKIPKSAAVNESVELAKRYGHKSSSNFVNAILRKISKKDYEEFFNIKDDIERISKTYSIPDWLLKRLSKQLNIKEIEEVSKYSNIRPKISIRVNKLKTTKEKLIKNLKKRNIKIEEGFLEDFLILENAKNIEEIEEFKEGKFTVQDETAGLIPIILEPKPEDIILDACSSPGGKTTYLAEMMEDKGKIEAWDIHEHRTKLVEEAAKRLGITIIKENVNDASIYNEKYKEKFDKILLDVPCLGTGVLKRKPDIKWQKNEEDIEEITSIQKKILQSCSKYLKKGGNLIYSTCSILKEENENIVEDFLKDNKDFEIVPIDIEKNKKIINKEFFEKYKKLNKYFQLYQNNYTDGFFICKLTKKTVKNQQKSIYYNNITFL